MSPLPCASPIKGFDDVDSFLKVSLLNIHIPWLMRLTYSLPVRLFCSPNQGHTYLGTHPVWNISDRVNKILAPAMADILDFRRVRSSHVR